MTVKELIDYLRECNQSDRVLIATNDHEGRPSMNPTKQGVSVAHIYNGFDWDKGTVYIIGNLDLEVVKEKK